MALTSPLKVKGSLQHSPGSFTADLPAAFYKNRKTAAAFIGENEGFSPLLSLNVQLVTGKFKMSFFGGLSVV